MQKNVQFICCSQSFLLIISFFQDPVRSNVQVHTERKQLINVLFVTYQQIRTVTRALFSFHWSQNMDMIVDQIEDLGCVFSLLLTFALDVTVYKSGFARQHHLRHDRFSSLHILQDARAIIYESSSLASLPFSTRRRASTVNKGREETCVSDGYCRRLDQVVLRRERANYARRK